MKKYFSLFLITMSVLSLDLSSTAPLQAHAQTASASCYTFTRSLGVGRPMNALEAIALAQDLASAGVWTAGVPITTYDNTVAAAVSGFQVKYTSAILTPNGLTSGTGLVGISTRAKLNSLYGCQTQAPVTTSSSAAQCPVGYACTPLGQAPAATSMTSTGSHTPVIMSLDGPTPVVLAQIGTWTIQASDPQNSSLKCAVNWGDDTSSPAIPIPSSQPVTLNHAYSAVGTYTPTFTVTDSAGWSTASSIVVQVSTAITATAAYIDPSVTVGSFGSPTYTVTTQGTISGYTAATFPLTFTVSAGTLPVYISAAPAAAVGLSSYLPGSTGTSLLSASGVSAISIDGGTAAKGDTNQGAGTQATGSFIVQPSSSRTFTVNIKLNNAGAGSVVNDVVTGVAAIYYSLNSARSGSTASVSKEYRFNSDLGTARTPPVTLLGIGTPPSSI